MKAKLALLLLMLLLPLAALADTLRVENDALILTIDEATLDLTVTDKATGLTLKSGVDATGTGANKSWTGFLASTLVVDVASGTAVTTKNYDIHSASADITLTPVEGGADAVVDFTDIGQRITLRIRLEGDSVALTVPADGVEEYGETALCGLYLLPALGATKLDEHTGYMLVPEAAGAIINFTDGSGVGTTPFYKRIYGANVGTEKSVLTELNRPAEQVTLPVYGLTRTDDEIGYLAVVEAGEEAAEVMAYPAGVITKFNWAAAHFTMREQYIAQTTRTVGLNKRESAANLRDMTVRFYLLTGKEATYAGMARRYRAALEAAGQLRDSDTAYRPRLDFLGAESVNFLLWNSVEPMTSLSQAREALDAYNTAGFTSPLVLLRGWQRGGLTYALGSGDVALEGQVGRRDELAALAEQVRKEGGRFLLEIDPVQANPDRMYNMRLDIVRTIGQMVAEVNTGKQLYPTLYYLTPSRTAEILANMEKAWKNQVDGLALTTMPNALYSYYSNGANHTRQSTMADYLAAMERSDAFLALENPLAGYFARMDTYLDMPLNTTSYSFLSAEVPFLPLVLSGHVPYYAPALNFESNQRKALLKLVEYGAYPTWLLTGNDVQKLVNTNANDVFTAQWEVLLEPALTIDATLAELHRKLNGAVMTNHELVENDVARVTYSNGVQLLINYRRVNAKVDGLTIPAQGWLVLEGGGTE